MIEGIIRQIDVFYAKFIEPISLKKLVNKAYS